MTDDKENTVRAILILLLLGVSPLAWARGAQTTVVNRTAYFPGGPGHVIVVRGQQGTISPVGARTTRITSGKRKLTKREMDALQSKLRIPKGKFATHQTWTVISTRKKPF